jgi:Tol biopolymer transport system component
MFRSTRCRLAVAALVLLTALVGGSLAPAQAAFQGANGKIAFVSYRDGNPEIYAMNADGSGQTRLTDSPFLDYLPDWSPDGARIAFGTNRDDPLNGNNIEIYTMDPQGTSLERITHDDCSVDCSGVEVTDTYPRWSPDGDRFALVNYPDRNGDIFVMNADGTGKRRLTNDGADDLGPRWSPDGSKIAFFRGGEIYVMNSDGTGEANLTDNFSRQAIYPDWSPDGSKIVFTGASSSANDTDIYVMNTDGTGITDISNYPVAYELYPAWSPDGSKVAFVTNRDGNYEIYTMNADGSNQTRLTTDSAVDEEPTWQPIPVVNDPPDCSSVTTSPTALSPANHRFRLVTLLGATDPDGDNVTTTVTGVTQDERVTGPGDHTSPDAVAGDVSNEIRIRAERSTHGDGRVYRIAFELSDGKGGTCIGRATVEVRKRKDVPAIDSAPPSYDSFGL